MRVRRAVGLLAIGVVCCSSGAGITGARGAVEFHYTSCRALVDSGCTGGLEPIAAGGSQVVIEPRNARGCGGAASFANVQSTNMSVFMVTPAANGLITVTSGNPGQADLLLTDSGGNEIDRITLSVVAPSTIQLANPIDPRATILDGVPHTIHFDRLGPTGAVLLGYGGIDYTLPAPLVRDDSPPEPDDGYFHGSPITFHGSDGTAKIVASAGTASMTFDVSFVSLGSIANIAILPNRYHVVDNGISLTAIDAAGALSDGTAVFGAECTWTAVSGDVAIYTSAKLQDLAAASAELTPLVRSYFRGSGTATCDVGATSQTINIP
jgi:hypothetical protein